MRLRLCASIGEPTVARCRGLLRGVRFAELRLDLIGDLDVASVRSLFSLKKELIATCRAGRFTEAERLALLGAAIAAGAAFVDLDLDTDLRREEFFFARHLLAFARRRGCRLVASRHFSGGTPSDRTLFSTVRRLASFDPAFIKVASRADSEEDAARLLALMALDRRVVPVAMGEWGPAGRIAALRLGAPFAYVTPPGGRVTAPGQIDAALARELLGAGRALVLKQSQNVPLTAKRLCPLGGRGLEAI